MVATFHIEPESNNITKLNNLLNNKTKKIMYVVHRPGCPACDSFMPNWHNFEENMKKKNNEDIVLAKINVNVLALVDLKDKHNIMGVPHIVLQNGNNLTEYTGNRHPKDLENWLFTNYVSKMGGKKRKVKKTKHQKKKSLKNNKRKKTIKKNKK